MVNLFLQVFLGSLIPNLAGEFLLFADDYVMLFTKHLPLATKLPQELNYERQSDR